MWNLLITCLCVCLFAIEEARAGDPSPINLKRKLVSVDIDMPDWAKALNLFESRLGFPFLLELNTLTYRSASMYHGKTEAEAATLSKLFKVHLKNVTVEEAIKFILKDQAGYNYEVIDGVVLHVYPNGIQNRTNYPLNTVVSNFAIEQKDISKDWYMKEFGALVDPMRIDLGNTYGYVFGTCLSPRVFHNVTLREILIALAKTCRTQWVFEPLPPDELRLRVAEWGDDFYPQGKRIEARGGDWYQLQCLNPKEDTVVDGVLR